jgi:hypothetical protein
VEQSFETMWRMAKLAGGIDATVKLIETIIATAPTLKFQNIAGKEIPIRDLAGLARSVQAGTSVPQGASFDLRDVQFLENRFVAIQADTSAMLAQLAGAGFPNADVSGTMVSGPKKSS